MHKIRPCFPTLIAIFEINLKSHVVYEIKCNECKAKYICRQAAMLPLRYQISKIGFKGW